MLKRIGLYGVSGSGKTTILKELSQIASNTIWLEGAGLVLKSANLSLSEFKNLSESEKYYFRELAISHAFKIQEDNMKHIIIDGHLAFAKNENDFENIMTEMDKKFYTDFIYLKLTPETIFKRQQGDLDKRRSYSLGTIAQWIEYELKELNKVCKERNINLFILESESNQQCIKFITEVLNKI